MKIIDKDNGEVFYDSGLGDEFHVTRAFWERLKKDGITYMHGGQKGDIHYID